MLNRIKRFLGIEGVKIKFLLPEMQEKAGYITGKIAFSSSRTETVEEVTVTLTEIYQRGWRKSKITERFVLGTITLSREFEVPAGKDIFISFQLPYSLYYSEMDRLGARNPLLKGVAAVAKKVGKVHSRYELTAEAIVKGTGLHPFDKVEVKIKEA